MFKFLIVSCTLVIPPEIEDIIELENVEKATVIINEKQVLYEQKPNILGLLTEERGGLMGNKI